MSFFWYSITGDAEQWKLVTSDQRQNVAESIKPLFTTVLDADTEPQPEWGRADYLKMKYSGPLYFDWDAGDLNLAIAAFNQFLDNLVSEHAFDLTQARLYATGGRGFHLEVPMEVFLPKVPPSGITQLPLIYREVAARLYVDTLDMRIYSCRRGRMWRAPGVQRPNGKYKVPISVEEARTMTPQLYDKLCAAPRLYVGRETQLPSLPWLIDPKGEVPPPTPASLCLSLQALFASAKASTDRSLSVQRKVRDDRQALAKFEGQPPVSVKEILNGQHLNPEAHFNDIALQFAILGAQFGMSEDDFVTTCDGLVKSHSGDSSRYSTPRRRADALRERYAYVTQTDVYTFSLNALRSVLDAKALPADLFKGVADGASRYAPELPAKDNGVPDLSSVLTDEQAQEVDALDMYQGLRVGPSGIWVEREAGKLVISDMAIFNPTLTLRNGGGEDVVDVSAWVVPMLTTPRPRLKEVVFQSSDFSSSRSLANTLGTYGSSWTGTDQQANLLRKILMDTAHKQERVTYVLSREGIDLVDRPDLREGNGSMPSTLVWATADRVVLPEDVMPDGALDSAGERVLSYRPGMSVGDRQDTDIDAHLFDPPEYADAGFLTFMRSLLAINSPQTVALTLGWFVACFHRVLHDRVHGEFPILWIYGAAGSGKTSTPTLLSHLFSSRPPAEVQLQAGGVTPFAWKVLQTQSTTVPVLVDEFKKPDFHPRRYNEILSDLRGAYTMSALQRGGATDGSARSSYREVRNDKRSTPIVIMSEAFTDESAVLERLVPVAVRPEDASHRAWREVNRGDNREYLTRLGSLLIRRTLLLQVSEFEERWYAALDESKARLPRLQVRPQSNYAAVTLALDFLADSLEEGVGLTVREEVGALREAVFDAADYQTRTGPVAGEAIKTLRDIAYLTKDLESTHPYAIREGHEYAFVGDKLHINMRNTALRYAAVARGRGMHLYFDSPDTLVKGLSRMAAVVDDNCVSSPLYTHKGATIFSFDPRVLAENNVEPFKGQPDL